MRTGQRFKKRVIGEKPKVSDRPHWVTIVTSVIGTLGTVTALLLTVQSLKNANRAIALSEQSMRTGQQAYVSVANGRLDVSAEDVLTNPIYFLHQDHPAQKLKHWNPMRLEGYVEINNLLEIPRPHFLI